MKIYFLERETNTRRNWAGEYGEFSDLAIYRYQAEITALSGPVVVVRRAPYWGPRGVR